MHKLEASFNWDQKKMETLQGRKGLSGNRLDRGKHYSITQRKPMEAGVEEAYLDFVQFIWRENG